MKVTNGKIFSSIDEIRRRHQQLGIPDDISWETLSIVARKTADGVQLTRWESLRLSGDLYQVGRIEVTPYRLLAHPHAGPLFWYDDEECARLGPGFRRGDPALGTHIPASEPLTPQACDESFHRIRTGFAGIYPGQPLRVATCTSWLLDDQLAEYLPGDSNIVAFQKRFALVPGARDEDEAILQYVFGPEHPKNLGALSQNTTLERAVAGHLRKGRHWRMRTGWLALNASSNR